MANREYTPRPYQTRTTDFIKRVPRCFVIEGMGLGKTVATLTALSDMFDSFEIARALVIAPKRVAAITWPDEVATWAHLAHLRVEVAIGTPKQRKAAIDAGAPITTINVENVPWIVAEYGVKWPFDAIILDESSLFKAHDSKRFEALKMVVFKTPRLVLLTGTPSAKSLMGLWAQCYTIDKGAALGKNITAFRRKYCVEKPIRGTEHMTYEVADGRDKVIYEAIAPYTFTLDAADHINLPDITYIERRVHLSPETAQAYADFERDKVLELLQAVDNDVNAISVASAAALSSKLRQFAQGAVYDEHKRAVKVHDHKLDELAELLDEAETEGENVLLFYQFTSDAQRIIERFPFTVWVGGKSGTTKSREIQIVQEWNEGKIRLLIAHPASLGHGMNLQHGGAICAWFGRNWSTELWLQANKRIHRPGVTRPVRVYSLTVPGTVEDKMVAQQDSQETAQNAMISAMKDLANTYLRETIADAKYL